MGQEKKSKDTILSEIFVSDVKTVGRDIYHDVLIPAIKNFLYDSTMKTANKMLFGGTKDIPAAGSTSGTNYNRVSSSGGYTRTSSDYKPKIIYKSDFVNAADAEQTANDMLREIVTEIEEHGSVAMSRVYSILRLPSEFSDNYWGYYPDDIPHMRLREERDRYIVDLPRPRSIRR